MTEKEKFSPVSQGGVDWLDVLLMLAQNIKLLTIWPLVAGLCALGMGFLLPPTYQSVSLLQADQATASLMSTTPVLDSVIATLGLAKGESIEDARRHLKAQVLTTVDRNDKLLTLTVSAETAQQSQLVAHALLHQTYLESRPKGHVLARLEAQLAEAKIRLNNAQSAAGGLLRNFKSGALGVNGSAEVARGYAELLNATGAAQTQISALEAQLEGVSDSLLIQPPTLPVKASQPKKLLMAITVALAVGMVLLLFVFMRQAWLSTLGSAEAQEKLARIRQLLGLQ